MKVFAHIFIGMALFCSQAWGQLPENTAVSRAALDHARQLLRTHPLVDGHNDLPWLLREESGGDPTGFDLKRRNQFDTDIPRLREGLVGGQFWSVWIPGETPVDSVAEVQLEQIQTVRSMIEAYPDTFELALTAEDVESAFRSGKIASLIGMEGGYALENSIKSIQAFHRLGVRYMTLTHNLSLDWADAGLGDHAHGGLTEFGRDVVREMNRVGVLIDLSHTSDDTMRDVLDTSSKPVIWSHAAARGLVDHPRNVPDDVLRRVPANDGVVMVTFISAFVSTEVMAVDDAIWEGEGQLETVRDFRAVWSAYDRQHSVPRATVSDVADHIEYIRDMAGSDHVGIGSDYWGMNDMPVGLEDVSKFPLLFAELIERGWSDEDLIKLAGGNILRVLRQACRGK